MYIHFQGINLENWIVKINEHKGLTKPLKPPFSSWLLKIRNLKELRSCVEVCRIFILKIFIQAIIMYIK